MFIIFVISSVLSLDFMSINKHIVRRSTKLPINHKVSMFLVLPISIACQFRGGWFYNQGLSSHFRFFYKLSKLRETINVYGKKCYLDNVPTLPKEKEERVDSRFFFAFLKNIPKKRETRRFIPKLVLWIKPPLILLRKVLKYIKVIDWLQLGITSLRFDGRQSGCGRTGVWPYYGTGWLGSCRFCLRVGSSPSFQCV